MPDDTQKPPLPPDPKPTTTPPVVDDFDGEESKSGAHIIMPDGRIIPVDLGSQPKEREDSSDDPTEPPPKRRSKTTEQVVGLAKNPGVMAAVIGALISGGGVITIGAKQSERVDIHPEQVAALNAEIAALRASVAALDAELEAHQKEHLAVTFKVMSLEQTQAETLQTINELHPRQR